MSNRVQALNPILSAATKTYRNRRPVWGMSTTMSVLAASAIALHGCTQTPYRFSIESDPGDASIYIDGELKGQGDVSLETPSEYGPVKSYEIKISKEGYRGFRTELRSEPDYSYAVSSALPAFLVGIVFVVWGFSTRTYAPIIGGVLNITILGPFYFLNNNRFKKVYSFELEESNTK